MADYSTSTPLTTNTGLVYGLIGVSNTNNPILLGPSSIGDRTLTFTAPTGFSVVGSPLTGTGTISLGFSAGYSLPTTASQTNWNTAYGWGDHAAVGYLTSFTETDPVFSAAPASGIAAGDISNWNTAYGWGDHAAAGYLDDYEEGTWTPTIEGNSGASGQTYSSQSGHYVKVGRQVTAWFSVQLSNKGTLSGLSLVIAGLPFTMENDNGVGQGVIVYWDALTANVSSMMLNNFANEAKAYINHAVGGGNTLTQNNTTIIGTSARLDGMVTYREV